MQEALTLSAKQQLRRQLTAFFITTFAFSWGIFGSALAIDFTQPPIVILGISGPTLSAILVTAMFNGTDGLKRFLSRINAKME